MGRTAASGGSSGANQRTDGRITPSTAMAAAAKKQQSNYLGHQQSFDKYLLLFLDSFFFSIFWRITAPWERDRPWHHPGIRLGCVFGPLSSVSQCGGPPTAIEHRTNVHRLNTNHPNIFISQRDGHTPAGDYPLRPFFFLFCKIQPSHRALRAVLGCVVRRGQCCQEIDV